VVCLVISSVLFVALKPGTKPEPKGTGGFVGQTTVYRSENGEVRLAEHYRLDRDRIGEIEFSYWTEFDSFSSRLFPSPNCSRQVSRVDIHCYVRPCTWASDSALVRRFMNVLRRWERNDRLGALMPSDDPTLLGVTHHRWKPWWPGIRYNASFIGRYIAGGIVFIALIQSIRHGRKGLQDHRRRRAGLCKHCGYDLRGTPVRCPECGEEPLHTADR